MHAAVRAPRRHPQLVRDLNNPVPGLHRQHGPVVWSGRWRRGGSRGGNVCGSALSWLCWGQQQRWPSGVAGAASAGQRCCGLGPGCCSVDPQTLLEGGLGRAARPGTASVPLRRGSVPGLLHTAGVLCCWSSPAALSASAYQAATTGAEASCSCDDGGWHRWHDGSI